MLVGRNFALPIKQSREGGSFARGRALPADSPSTQLLDNGIIIL